VRRDPVVVGQRLLDEPGCVQVGFTVERVLKERPNVHLAVHLAVAANVVLVDECLVSSWVVQANEVPSKGIEPSGPLIMGNLAFSRMVPEVMSRSTRVTRTSSPGKNSRLNSL
jgi:hypothetical protein